MSEQKEQEISFGDYVTIEQHRFGVPNEMYKYKVIGVFRSNVYVDVPVKCPETETSHGEVQRVVACIRCGVNETQVSKFRLQDVQLIEVGKVGGLRYQLQQVEQERDDLQFQLEAEKKHHGETIGKSLKAIELALGIEVERDALREANTAMREGLEFYASFYSHEVEMEDTGMTQIQTDGGKKARSILSQYTKGDTANDTD